MGIGITWEKLIQKCLEGWDDILARQPKDETWAFEVCCPHNQVVVRHQGFYAKLLAIRNNRTLLETDIETLPWLPADKRPKSYRFNNAAEVAEFANTIPASQNEGFVVVDGNFNRIKIKSDQYVALHRLKDGLNGINNLILLARGNDYEEVVGHFPEYKEDLDIVAGLINETVARHEIVFEECKGIVSQKDFALEIQTRGLESTACLFLTRARKKPSIKTAFAEMADTPFLGVFKAKIKQALGSKYADEVAETEVK